MEGHPGGDSGNGDGSVRDPAARDFKYDDWRSDHQPCADGSLSSKLIPSS
jgi:hypothetical protein